MTTRRTADALVGMAALQEGLSELRSVEGSRREQLESELSLQALKLAGLCHTPVRQDASDKPPPKSVGLALGLAIHSQPHLAVTLDPILSHGTEDIAFEVPAADGDPVVRPDENLREALGLQEWELDDLREEVDRRVGRLMKQERAVQWLWTHFGLPHATPESLFRHLFPGVSGRLGEIGLYRRGSQLYAVLDHATQSKDALYLSWRSQDESNPRAVGTFRGRYVAEALRESLARAIGASSDEVVHLLDHMVAVIPRGGGASFLAHDHWRVRGAAAITGLASPYPSATWLEGRVWPEAIPTEAWLSVQGGKITVRRARAVFDKLALIRTTVMMRQVYGQLVAQFSSHPGLKATDSTVLPLYELGYHLRSVLRPLLAWASDPHTATYLATKHSVSPEEAQRVLAEINDAWQKQADEVWCGAPVPGSSPTVQANLALHLMCTASSISDVLSRAPDHRWPHRDLLLLFVGHYFANAPIQRLWANGETPAEIDPVGRWFWGAWQRVSDAGVEMDSATWSGPAPEGLT